MACSLLTKVRKNQLANRYLAIILMLLGLDLLHEFLINTHYIYWVPPLIGTTMQFDPLFGSLIYLYIRELTHPDLVPEHKMVAAHFLPALIYLIAMIPFYMLSFEEKLNFSQHGYALNKLTGLPNALLSYYVIFNIILYTIYLTLSFRLLAKHRKKISHYFSYREKITLNWLRYFLIICVLYWLFIIDYLSLSEITKPTMLILTLLTVVIIHYLGIQGILQPRIFKQYIQRKPCKSLGITVKNELTKYKKSALNAKTSQDILNRLTSITRNDKPYLNNTLSLPDLAEKVGVSHQHLSQVINEQLHMNFFDYINSYRISMAQKLIINPLPHTLTILDIAMEVGFNSKSSFYTAFKKQVQLTPVQYKKKMLEDGR